MGKFQILSEKMGQAQRLKDSLLGLGMDLPQDERDANDMTKTGKFCPKDGTELEKVSNEDRHTCHWCGGIFKINEKGEVYDTWFEGFE